MTDWKPNYNFDLEPSPTEQIPATPAPTPVAPTPVSSQPSMAAAQAEVEAYQARLANLREAHAVAEAQLERALRDQQTKPSLQPVDWLNWIQRIAIAILICIVVWLIYRSEFGSPMIDSVDVGIDFAAMDSELHQARTQIFTEVAKRAESFKDLQALIDWQDQQFQAARSEIYKPWMELLREQLDEDRYKAELAERIFRAAAKASSY